MVLNMKSLFAVLSISVALANSFQVDFPHDPKSTCPQYWVDATHVGMVRNLFQLDKFTQIQIAAKER